MIERFIVFDVETPNHENSRMSAIGITVIDDREITQKLYYTINPNTYFDAFNIQLTGISPEIVANSPTFPKVWEEIGPLFMTGTLIAHNAPFDMSVLSKCLRDYNLQHPRTFEYACTCRMAKKIYPNFENHKLDTISRYLNIQLSHHNAMSDALACATILLDILKKGININNFIKSYDVLLCKTISK